MVRTQEQKDSDQKVREYMRQHPEVVEKVARRREELNSLSTAELASLAELGLDIDVSRVREELIAVIVTTERKS